jgi:eukaryotic-like serine/threonine-protein kinase
VAKSVESELAACFALLEQELRRNEFLEVYQPVVEHPLLAELNDAWEDSARRQPLRESFRTLPERTTLRDQLADRLIAWNQRTPEDAIRLASIFVLDRSGTHVAAAYVDPVVTSAVGRNYSWRTYFHGGPQDGTRGPPDQLPEHVRTTHLSAPFKSSATETWRVAITAPVYDRRESEPTFLGVMGLTINVGDFAVFRHAQQRTDYFAVLVDDRQGEQKGTVLQHPLFRVQRPTTDYRVPEAELARIRSQPVFDYRDPLAAAPGGDVYNGDWIAAAESVDLPGRNESSSNNKTHLLVLVQVAAEATTIPVRELARRLAIDAAVALMVIVLVVLALWVVVFQISGRRRASGGADPGDDTSSSVLQTTIGIEQ